MAKLIYSVMTSLDGFIEDKAGDFYWATPDEEVHRFINKQESRLGSFLYGRKMYEAMRAWEDPSVFPEQADYLLEFAQFWKAADKIVFSKKLKTISTENTSIQSNFDPVLIGKLKNAAGKDLSIGGACLAAHAIKAKLVDEFHLYVAPVVIGSGKAWLSKDLRVALELQESKAFKNGMVFLRYQLAI